MHSTGNAEVGGGTSGNGTAVDGRGRGSGCKHLFVVEERILADLAEEVLDELLGMVTLRLGAMKLLTTYDCMIVQSMNNRCNV